MIWACLLSEGVDCLHLLLPELLHLQALFTIGQGLHPDFVKSASLFFWCHAAAKPAKHNPATQPSGY